MTQLVPTFAGRIVQLTRITAEGKTFLARREEDHYVELPFEEFSQLLAEENWSAAAGQDGRQIPLSMVHHQRLLDPAHVFCIGLNYKGHIQETGKPTPQYPTVFAKFASSLTGPFSDIDLPLDSHEVDWEVELGIIIGKAARNVSIEQAPEHIAGYTLINDISMRDWQSRTNQWFQGKNFEKSTPVGPFLVTPDEIDGARDLQISCSINGETMQNGRTSDLLFSPTELVSYISQFTTLLPGDLIASGTPSGVGMAKVPKRFLQEGDVLLSEIEGIGLMSNRFVAKERTGI
jgi:acylpyruvate hydrolase